MKEFNSVLEVLHECRTQLIEAKARIKEREAEIDKYLSDYDKAIDAITPKFEVTTEQPQEPTERLPKVGDELVAICETDENLTNGKPYSVIASTNDHKDPRFVILDDTGKAFAFPYATWRKYFRFADEPTPEDMSNLHSYLHAKGEAKKPYRIKTRQEMIDGGARFYDDYNGHRNCIKHPDSKHLFANEMTVLFGSETETNEPHDIIIDGIPYAIDPWMITENK